MGFSKITALSLTDLFVQQIENMILSGELRVGERLPPARELSARMEISRPVISAGMIELEKLGFVEIRPRQGVYVCDYRRKGSLETLVAIMRYNGGAMRESEVRALLEVRASLESLCVRLLTESPNADIESLYPLLETLRVAKSAEEAAEAVYTLHHEMAILSGNALLPLLYHSFKPEGVHLWTLYCKNNSIDALYRIKARLFGALRAHDTEAVVSQTEEIMRNAIDSMELYGVRP